MADAVAGLGNVYAVRKRDGLYIRMVVRVELAGLQHIVVDVRDAAFGFHLVHARGLELQVRHGTRRILREGLVDFYRDFLAGDHIPAHEVLPDYFARKIHSASFPLPSLLMVIR